MPGEAAAVPEGTRVVWKRKVSRLALSPEPEDPRDPVRRG